MHSFLKSLLITTISIILLTGCTTSQQETETPPFKIAQISAEASCYKVELQDQNGNSVKVPKEIEENFECVTESTKLSPNTKCLLYETYENEKTNLKLYNLETEKINPLMSFNETPNGLACKWNNNSREIACVEINQEKYEALTKIIIFEIDKDGKLTQTKEFSQKQGETVDFVCGASCYPGEFWFEGENTLKYNGHQIISPNKIYTIKY